MIDWSRHSLGISWSLAFVACAAHARPFSAQLATREYPVAYGKSHHRAGPADDDGDGDVDGDEEQEEGRHI